MNFPGGFPQSALLRSAIQGMPVAAMRRLYTPDDVEALIREQNRWIGVRDVRRFLFDVFLVDWKFAFGIRAPIWTKDRIKEYLTWIVDECGVTVDLDMNQKCCDNHHPALLLPRWGFEHDSIVPSVWILDFYLRRTRRPKSEAELDLLLWLVRANHYRSTDKKAACLRLLDAGATLAYFLPHLNTEEDQRIARWYSCRLRCRAACLALLAVGRRRRDLAPQKMWQVLTIAVWAGRFIFDE